MAELIEMEKVAGRYQSKHDLMQDIPQSRNERIDVKDHFGESKKGYSGPKSSSSSNAKAKASSTTVNNKTENVYTQDNAEEVEVQTKAINAQSKTLNEQTGLMKAQSGKLDNLNITMEKLYDLLYREHHRLNPKYQGNAMPMLQPDFAGTPPDENGQTNGFADLAGSIMDMMGGGNGKGKGKRKPKIQKTGSGMKGKFGKAWDAMKSMGGTVLGLGEGAAEGGLGSRIMQGAKGMFAGGGGGGWRGKLLKGAAAAGAAAVGYKGLESLGGLGAVSAMFESGKGGVGTISTGKGDHGGVSYGAHQLSSKSGTMAKFLRSEQGSAYAQEFAGLQPGTAEFNQKYKEVVGRDSKGFEEAQAGFMKATHYDPAARKLANDTGLDVSKRSRALQELVYSTSTQYGGGSSVLAKALAGRDASSMSDEELINTMQDYKRDNVGVNFKSSSADVQASVAQRAEREKATLQKILADERKNPQGVMKGEDKKGVDGNTAAQVALGKTDPQSLPVDSKAQQQTVGIMPMQPQDVKADEALGRDDSDDSGFVTVDQAAGGVSTMDQAGMALAGGGVVKAGVDGSKAATATKAAITSGEKATLKGAAKVGGKLLGPAVSIGMDGYRAAEVISDDKMSSAKKETELAGIGGSMAGAVAGGALGATVGSVVPIAGTAVGGVVGSIGGAIVGEEGVKAGVNYVLGTPEEREAKAAQKMYINSPLVQGEHSTLPAAPVALPSVKDLMKVPAKSPTELQTSALAAPAKPADATPKVVTPSGHIDAKSAAEALTLNDVKPNEELNWKPTPDEMAAWKAMTVPVNPNAPSFHKTARDLAAKQSGATPGIVPETKVAEAPKAAPAPTPSVAQTPTPAPTKTFEMPKQEAAPPSVTAPTYSDIKPFQQPTVTPNTPTVAANTSTTPGNSAAPEGMRQSVNRLATAAQSLADSAAKMASAGGVKDGKDASTQPGQPGMPSAAPAGMQSVEAKPAGTSLFDKLNPFSPASPQFYKTEPAISQRPQMAAPVVSAAPTPVAAMPAREVAAPQPIDNISNIRMATQVPQAPAAPAAPAAKGGGNSAGGKDSSKGTDKPTLDEIPALINDFGLLFVNSGLL